MAQDGGVQLYGDEGSTASGDAFAKLAVALFPDAVAPEGSAPLELEIETDRCMVRMTPSGEDAGGRAFVSVRVDFKAASDQAAFETVEALRLMIRIHAGRPRGGENWEFGVDDRGTPFFTAEFPAETMRPERFDTVMGEGADHAELTLRMVRMANGHTAEAVSDLIHFRG